MYVVWMNSLALKIYQRFSCIKDQNFCVAGHLRLWLIQVFFFYFWGGSVQCGTPFYGRRVHKKATCATFHHTPSHFTKGHHMDFHHRSKRITSLNIKFQLGPDSNQKSFCALNHGGCVRWPFEGWNILGGIPCRWSFVCTPSWTICV